MQVHSIQHRWLGATRSIPFILGDNIFHCTQLEPIGAWYVNHGLGVKQINLCVKSSSIDIMEPHSPDTRIVKAMIKPGSQIITCGLSCLRTMEICCGSTDFCKIAIPKGLRSDQDQCQGGNSSRYDKRFPFHFPLLIDKSTDPAH